MAVWIVCAMIVIFLFEKITSETTTKAFCAYNRMFIEFEEGHHRWGVMMLDLNGKPIPCKEEELPTSGQTNTRISI